ncbi:Tuberous sclerosis 1 protein-like protein [Apiospora arundinis]|uniref:Tuberous sclerosis 1 n=1 Tax=Apiospora arundinis TaxID=335852 RepID=A0ABR2IUM3_9PEZI
MASAPSFKELSKAISSFIITARLPLPDDLIELIEGYLEKHEKFDESVSDKLNDDLIAIYQKDVKGTQARYAPFLNILRRLRPMIGQPAKVIQWWELLLPMLDLLNQEKDLASQAQKLFLAILTSDDGNDAEDPNSGAAVALAEKVMAFWAQDRCVAIRADAGLAVFKEKQLRDVLIIYGKRHPRDFMGLLDKYMVDKKWRPHALNLMGDYVQSQPPHLHQILQTPIFGTLINILQLDTSTTVVTLALTVLTMILPHMPSSLVPHLSTLFNVYARILFWERELSAIELGVDTHTDQRIPPNSAGWQKMSYMPEYEERAIPQLLNYFTILYGLYPINFMDYIRKPQRYLRHADAPDTDDIEVQPTEIRHASEQFRQCHLLHENFYTLTIDSEKTDFGRWIKSEPAEVVANCMALRHSIDMEVEPELPFGQPGARNLSTKGDLEKDMQDQSLLSASFSRANSSFSGTYRENGQSPFVESPTSTRSYPTVIRQSSQSSRQSLHDSSSIRPPGRGGESPALQAQLTSFGSQTHLQDLINSNKAIKSELHQSLANDSVQSLALSQQESNSERPGLVAQGTTQYTSTPASATAVGDDQQYYHLYRQIMLLHNDLTFERFMKQQHLTHMGELRSRLVREAASEAEAQNLILAHRQLKQRLEEAKKIEVQTKKDSERSRTLAKKWEADLSSKLRVLREEQRKWNAERESLLRDLEVIKVETDKLRVLVSEAETRELGWKQRVQSVEADASELEHLRKEVERLTVSERNYQSQENERQAAMAGAEEADRRAEMLEMKLKARGVEIQQAHDLYQSQITVLNSKLQDALKTGTEKRADGLKAQVESLMATSRTQQEELKKRIADLTSKNAALNVTILELQSQMPHQPPAGTPRRPLSPDADMAVRYSTDSGSPMSYRNRQHRGLSDPENYDSALYNSTETLEPYSSSLHIGSPRARSSTPSNAEGSIRSGGGSPTGERYYGRGGVQNILRKDRRDESRSKDRKKSGGIRGIRGFV